MTVQKDPKRKQVVYIVDDDDGMRRALTVLTTTVGYQPVAFAKASETEFVPGAKPWRSVPCAAQPGGRFASSSAKTAFV